MQTAGRFRSLDGLRGVAALVVVIYHVALTDAVVADKYLDPVGQSISTIERVAYYSPLHILWAGREAVIVFFVLSGFVLALRSARGRGETWRSYYPQRLVRLYVPAVGSLIFAWMTVLLVSRDETGGGSEWVAQHARDPHGFLQVVLGSTLMGGSGGLNTPLWSLRWEVVFSLLLPLYLYVGYRLRRHLAVAVALCALAATAGSATGVAAGALTYLPVFGVGVAMAYSLDDLRRWADQVTRPGWAGLTVLAVALLTAQWNIGGFVDDPNELRKYTSGAIVAGAALIVFVAAFCPLATRILEAKPLHWLGMISFSLYLVHEPVVVAFSFATQGDVPLVATYAACLPLSVIAGYLFYLSVEQPSHRCARRVKAWAERTGGLPRDGDPLSAGAATETDPSGLVIGRDRGDRS